LRGFEWQAVRKYASQTKLLGIQEHNNSHHNNSEHKEPTMNAVAEMPAPLVFTDSAADKVKQLIEEEGNDALKLRVFVQGGGCSGFQYGFTFDEDTNDDDTLMSKNGVSLVIDAMSYQYLVGAEIDYKEDINGAQFVIKNPNATTTCGCGSSFSA
jgi:iron-sulfur cluster insertion protein